jgi:AbrB family looped-hinge helix DNA binding protein
MIRRTDDVGRVVIPKEVRRMLQISENEPLEIFVDTENQMVCFQKYINTQKLSERCKQIANLYRKIIMSVNLTHYTTTIVTTEGEIGQATWNEEGDFDINIGIAYALVNAGYINREEIED